MLSLGSLARRTRLPRVTAPIARAQTRHSYSTKASPPPSNLIRNIAIAGAISTPFIWWFMSTRRDNDVALPSLKPIHPKDHVTSLISENAYSIPVGDVPTISRYDGTQLASNSPCEDRFTHGKFPSPWNDGSEWMAWAIFDGHAGWQTADLLEKKLVPAVWEGLGQVDFQKVSDEKREGSVQEGIMEAFVQLDYSIIKAGTEALESEEPMEEKVRKLAPAHAGSCALLSIYDSTTSTLHVACTGDSRAVLGKKRPDGKWEATPLSVDQTGYNQEETKRISAEHPGERFIFKDGRVLGLAVSRAFGDVRWKWPVKLQEEIKKKFNGLSPLTSRYDVRTPPYLTAQPVVTSTKIQPSSTEPSFLIMASDGLWDTMSSDQAVDLVGKWLESQSTGNSELEPNPSPLDKKPLDFTQFKDGVEEKFTEERTTIRDDNAAVHLVRNSLGGNHHELVAARLAFSAPFSRDVRDDMTVQVIFFNDNNNLEPAK